MVTVPTVYNYNYRKTITIINNEIEHIKDKWIGDNNCLLEKSRAKYFERDFKL